MPEARNLQLANERRQSLDQIADAERRQADARRRNDAEGVRRAQQQIDEQTRRLYGHLDQRRTTPRDQTPLDADASRRFMGGTPEERDRMLAAMPPAQRDQLTSQLRTRREETDRRVQDLLRNPASQDPRVQAARREHDEAEAASQRAWREYNDARQAIYEREQSFGNQLARLFGRDRPSDIADRETEDQRRAAYAASNRASEAEARRRAAEANPQLSLEQQRQRATFEAERQRFDTAIARVGLGGASRSDAERWLGATADARNRDLATGAIDRERGDSIRRHLDQMHRDLSTAPQGETQAQRAAREQRLGEIDSARRRLQHMTDAPAIYDARAQADHRISDLEAASRRRALTPDERRELEDHQIVRTGADRLRPEDNRREWSRWERDRNAGLEQETLRREWQQHVAQNPQALVDLNRTTEQARQRALAQLPADQRAGFERAFHLQTTFGRDGEGNLTYRVGYVPTEETTAMQTRQSLAAGLHMSQPAMEIPRYYRTDDFVRPGTPEESMLWHGALGEKRPGELMTRWSGGGLQDASMDFLWVTPVGAIRNMGAYTVGQFVRAAGTELAFNAAFGTAIHGVGQAVTDRFGERYGQLVPVVALLGTLATGRVMASPRVQAGIGAVRNSVGRALGRSAPAAIEEAAGRAALEGTGGRVVGGAGGVAGRTAAEGTAERAAAEGAAGRVAAEGAAGRSAAEGAAGRAAAEGAAGRAAAEGAAGRTAAGGAAGRTAAEGAAGRTAAEGAAGRAAAEGATPRAIPRPTEPRPITPQTRHTGADPAANIDLINQHGLQPRHTVTVDNVHYSFSDPFPIGNGRIGVLGVVDDGAQQTLRVFYRSNSQGTFRLLPAQNQGLGHLGLPGFDKAIGETALGLPAQAEARLSSLVSGGRLRTDIPVADAQRIFGGAAPVNRTPMDYMNYARSPDYVGAQVRQRPLIEPPQGAQRIPAGGGHEMLRPQDVHVPEPMQPNFNAQPVTYRTQTAAAGEVEAMVYPSANGQLEWTLFRDQQGRVWVGNVGGTQGPVTNLGVRATAVNSGELTTPLWEYHSQIPQGFAGAAHPALGQYASAWAYIRELPVIQAYYRARGLAVPP